jgi:hypothetical protein
MCGSVRNNVLRFGIMAGFSVALVTVIAIVAAGSFAIGNNFSEQQQEQDDISPVKITDEQPAGSIEPKVKNVEYYTEDKVQNLVDKGTFFGPGDSFTFELQIPDENVSVLEGSIMVEGKSYIMAKFTDASGGPYCKSCILQIFGLGSGKQVNNTISIPVTRGDSIKLTIENPKDVELQTVHVLLSVTYPIVKERLVGSTLPNVVALPDEPAPNANADPGVSFVSTNLEELRKYALQKINKDRSDHGLDPVELSKNGASQAHAEDVLRTLQISHWMTNGEKPYMTYSRYGGTGAVAQNVGLSGDADYANKCDLGTYLCAITHPYNEISRHEYGMMYDDAASDWGHRDNILDPYHTHVSIGIAYTDYNFVMVQNFENNYIGFDRPVTNDNRTITLAGDIGFGLSLSSINIYYDPIPTRAVYEQYKTAGSYGMGEIIAGVADDGFYYEDIETITANHWVEKGDHIDIQFDLKQIVSNEGVYTVIVWLEDKDGEIVEATTYSTVITADDL